MYNVMPRRRSAATGPTILVAAVAAAAATIPLVTSFSHAHTMRQSEWNSQSYWKRVRNTYSWCSSIKVTAPAVFLRPQTVLCETNAAAAQPLNARTNGTSVDRYYREHGRLPLPKVMHANLRDYEGIPEGRNVLIVGDVHGCYEELLLLYQKAVEEINGKKPFRHVILVGDLCNKGPMSAHVVRHVRNTPGWCAVRGNHDQAALAAAAGDQQRREKKKYEWAIRREEDHQKDSDDIALSDDDVIWLSELPFTISIDKEFFETDTEERERDVPSISKPSIDTIIVHAGLVPNVPLSSQTVNAMITLRDVTVSKNDESEQNAPIVYEYNSKLSSNEVETHPWASVWQGPQRVIFGHDAKRGLQQPDNGLAIGLDTGAVYGKELTGIVLPQERFVFVKSISEYCPIRSKVKPEK